MPTPTLRGRAKRLVRRLRLFHARTFDDVTAHSRTRLLRELDTTIGAADAQRIEALIALTHHGVLPIHSQCGGPVTVDGVTGQRTPYLWFIADEKTKNWIENVLYYASIDYQITVMEMHSDRSREKHAAAGRTVTRFDDRSFRIAGCQLTAAQLDDRFPVRPAAAAELHRRWQVLIYLDTTSERGTFMFEALAKAANASYDAIELSRQ